MMHGRMRVVARVLLAAVTFGVLALAGKDGFAQSTLTAWTRKTSIGTKAYCYGEDQYGVNNGRAEQSGSGIRAHHTVDGGSGSVNGTIYCGSSCNSQVCIPTYRRTSSVSGVGYSTTVYCPSGSSYQGHTCETWSPKSVACIEMGIYDYLGPIGSSTYEKAWMYESVWNKVNDTYQIPGGGGCGPLGC